MSKIRLTRKGKQFFDDLQVGCGCICCIPLIILLVVVLLCIIGYICSLIP